MRLAGISTGILEGQGRASGYFTSATGVTIYDGDQWPSTDHPIALIADVGSNLVHRKRLIRSGVASKGERIDAASEFLRSKDTWFRPVQFANGPDGCLYIVDMARETIEHPKSIPEPIKSQVDLTSGRDLGRIWRVRATGRPVRRDPVKLSSCTTAELCDNLGHRNGWHRETASQLLIERQDAQAIPICRKILATSSEPLARLHALAVLASLPDGLDRATWLAGIEDSSEHVRLWAWVFANRITGLSAESLRDRSENLQKLMQAETDLEVQMVIAVRSLKIFDGDEQRAKLVAAWLQRQDPALLACDELRAAIEIAIRGKAAKALWEQADWLTVLGKSNHGANFLDAILFQLQQHGDLVSLIAVWDQAGWTQEQSQVATEALGRLTERRIVAEGSPAYSELSKLAHKQLVPRLQAALQKGATDRQAEAELGRSDSQRASAIRLLGTLPIEQRQAILTQVLTDCPSTAIQCDVIESWVPGQPALQKLAAERLDASHPLVEQSIFKALVRNESGAKLLLDQLELKQRSAESIPAWVWQALRGFPADAIKKRAQKLSPISEVPWESVAAPYREAWNKPGDPKLGEAHFKKLCASCHRVMDLGVVIGPSLDSYRVRPNEAIALAVAEPSREMDPKYEQQQIRTKDGEVAAGILVASSQDRVTLLTAQNQSVTIARSDIEEWKSSGKSLMPEGMLKELDPQALNDLIAFLRLVP
jgi:putative heme-binding domain-containing protein